MTKPLKIKIYILLFFFFCLLSATGIAGKIGHTNAFAAKPPTPVVTGVIVTTGSCSTIPCCADTPCTKKSLGTLGVTINGRYFSTANNVVTFIFKNTGIQIQAPKTKCTTNSSTQITCTGVLLNPEGVRPGISQTDLMDSDGDIPVFVVVRTNKADLAQVSAKTEESTINFTGKSKVIRPTVTKVTLLSVRVSSTNIFSTPQITYIENPAQPATSTNNTSLLFRITGTGFVFNAPNDPINSKKNSKVKFVVRDDTHAQTDLFTCWGGNATTLNCQVPQISTEKKPASNFWKSSGGIKKRCNTYPCYTDVIVVTPGLGESKSDGDKTLFVFTEPE